MSKIVRLTESELVRLVKRMIKESEEGFERIDDEDFDDISDEEDDIEDYGFDVEDDFGDDDEFQTKMRYKERMRKDRPSGLELGAGTRWDSESEKEYNPIKPSDLPLDKFLKSKYNKM